MNIQELIDIAHNKELQMGDRLQRIIARLELAKQQEPVATVVGESDTSVVINHWLPVGTKLSIFKERT